MAGSRAPGVLLLGLLQLAQSSGQVPSCLEVRSSFQLLHPGVKWAPEKPVSGVPPQGVHVLLPQDGGAVPGSGQAEHGAQHAGLQHRAQVPHHPERSALPG
ncbi:hypothetical protein EOD39_13946 [Acipenser ruthenus]|uniref:Uncharacterized protein n=1 Tax=Acipenser ruthenus TaxID=7906 RepID=A0A662YMP0_ACIRT|nr:hypothetical protein EOD39_13946 [Acipenser ruthenus]